MLQQQIEPYGAPGGLFRRLRQGAAPAGVAEMVAEAPAEVAVIAEAVVPPVVITPAPAPADRG